METPNKTQDKLGVSTIVRQGRAYTIVSQNRRFHAAPARKLAAAPPKPVASGKPAEGNASGAMRATIAAALPVHTDSAGGGHVTTAAVETSWQRQYRLRKEAQAVSGAKSGCRGCGGV